MAKKQKKYRTLKPIIPNSGVTAQYQRALLALIDDMGYLRDAGLNAEDNAIKKAANQSFRGVVLPSVKNPPGGILFQSRHRFSAFDNNIATDALKVKDKAWLDPILEVIRKMPDGTVIYAEEVRTNKKTLTMLSMYKRKPQQQP